MSSLETINVMLDEGAYEPIRAYEFDAGMDLRSPVRKWVFAHNSVTIDTGVHIEIPKGYVGILKSKSGLNVKFGLTGTGVIDFGYSGSIVCKLYNNSNANYLINEGDKIIQIVIIPIATPKINLVTEFPESDRGDKGFGSSGR